MKNTGQLRKSENNLEFYAILFFALNNIDLESWYKIESAFAVGEEVDAIY